MRRRSRFLVLALTLSLGACQLFDTDLPLPRGAVPMAPLPEYGLWWRLTERCSGLTGDLAAVSWYLVPGTDSMMTVPLREWARGEYVTAQHRIVLTGHVRDNGFVVRHEMLHALLHGRGGHPPEYFQHRCYGVVASDPPPSSRDSSGAIVRPGDVVLAARVDSTAPSLSRDSGWVALTVSIRNPRTATVRVRLAPVQPGYAASATFGFVDTYCAPAGYWNGASYTFVDDSTLVLGPGETRQMIFDERVGRTCTVFRPFFNHDTLPDIRVVPVP